MTRRSSRRWIAAAVVVLALVAGGATAWYFGWQWIAPPEFRCETPDREVCDHTAEPWTWWEGIHGRPLVVAVHQAPPSWEDSGDPATRYVEWAVTIQRLWQDPMRAGCNYSSDQIVTCIAVSSRGGGQ